MCRRNSSKKKLKELIWGIRLSSHENRIHRRRCKTMHHSNDTSNAQAQARTPALQQIGINLYRYVAQGCASLDHGTVSKFELREKTNEKKRNNDANDLQPTRTRSHAASYSAAPTANYYSWIAHQSDIETSHIFCCRGPILIPRPDSETSAQTTRGNVL